mmetsp:Transcript_63899/g.137459  ORF Transcript_63899/g.137459 Transcript_63899/m.137459 type:complete len:244 (-) Transcript_63899:83-814(-)
MDVPPREGRHRRAAEECHRLPEAMLAECHRVQLPLRQGLRHLWRAVDGAVPPDTLAEAEALEVAGETSARVASAFVGAGRPIHEAHDILAVRYEGLRRHEPLHYRYARWLSEAPLVSEDHVHTAACDILGAPVGQGCELEGLRPHTTAASISIFVASSGPRHCFSLGPQGLGIVFILVANLILPCCLTLSFAVGLGPAAVAASGLRLLIDGCRQPLQERTGLVLGRCVTTGSQEQEGEHHDAR